MAAASAGGVVLFFELRPVRLDERENANAAKQNPAKGFDLKFQISDLRFETERLPIREFVATFFLCGLCVIFAFFAFTILFETQWKTSDFSLITYFGNGGKKPLPVRARNGTRIEVLGGHVLPKTHEKWRKVTKVVSTAFKNADACSVLFRLFRSERNGTNIEVLSAASRLRDCL